MLKRSEDNHKAALLLLSKGIYDGSVVAFYYSVLQRMMYALNEAEKRPLSYESQNQFNEEFHHKMMMEIKNRIQNTRQGNYFEDLFEELFNLRKKADYQADSISQDECARSRSLYEGLIERLNRYFPSRTT